MEASHHQGTRQPTTEADPLRFLAAAASAGPKSDKSEPAPRYVLYRDQILARTRYLGGLADKGSLGGGPRRHASESSCRAHRSPGNSTASDPALGELVADCTGYAARDRWVEARRAYERGQRLAVNVDLWIQRPSGGARRVGAGDEAGSTAAARQGQATQASRRGQAVPLEGQEAPQES